MDVSIDYDDVVVIEIHTVPIDKFLVLSSLLGVEPVKVINSEGQLLYNKMKFHIGEVEITLFT